MNQSPNLQTQNFASFSVRSDSVRSPYEVSLTDLDVSYQGGGSLGPENGRFSDVPSSLPRLKQPQGEKFLTFTGQPQNVKILMKIAPVQWKHIFRYTPRQVSE